MIVVQGMPEGTVFFAFQFGHQGASLFSNLNPEMAVSGPKWTQNIKQKNLFYKWDGII